MKPGDFSLTPFTLGIPVFKFLFDFCKIPLLERVFLKNRSYGQTIGLAWTFQVAHSLNLILYL